MTRRRKGGDHSLSALKSIRAARPDGAPIYVTGHHHLIDLVSCRVDVMGRNGLNKKRPCSPHS